MLGAGLMGAGIVQVGLSWLYCKLCTTPPSLPLLFFLLSALPPPPLPLSPSLSSPSSPLFPSLSSSSLSGQSPTRLQCDYEGQFRTRAGQRIPTGPQGVSKTQYTLSITASCLHICTVYILHVQCTVYFIYMYYVTMYYVLCHYVTMYYVTMSLCTMSLCHYVTMYYVLCTMSLCHSLYCAQVE